MASLPDRARRRHSVWLDSSDRHLVGCSGVQRLVGGRTTGVTTNPSTFNQAIGAGPDYDQAIRDLLEQSHSIVAAPLCQALIAGDVELAAYVQRTVYERPQGRDGYFVLEMRPT